MGLERKYGPLNGYTPVTDIVLNYLSEVKPHLQQTNVYHNNDMATKSFLIKVTTILATSEEFILQRVIIYSLLSAEGSLKSQYVCKP